MVRCGTKRGSLLRLTRAVWALTSATISMLGVGIAGCGNNSGDTAAGGSGSDTTGAPPSAAAPQTTADTASSPAAGPSSGTDFGPSAPAAPPSTAGGGAAVTSVPDKTTIDGKAVTLKKTASGLRYYDSVVGTGPEVKAGQTASVQYTGTLLDGSKFDSSYDHGGSPFDFPVGGGQVIHGWDEGVVGMKVGGKRRLVVPGDLAYGANSPTPAIPANATLVFDIELVGIK